MSSHTTPIVSVNVDLVSKEIDRQKKREEFVQPRRPVPVQDSVEIRTETGEYAETGEGEAPKGDKGTVFERLKGSKTELAKVIRETGRKISPEDLESDLSKIADEVVVALKEKIEELKVRGKDGSQMAGLEAKLHRVIKAQGLYEETRGEAFSTPDRESNSLPSEGRVTGETPVAPSQSVAQVTRSEEVFWKELESFGIVRDPSERNLPKVEEHLRILKGRLQGLSREIRAKENELKKAREVLRTAATPEAKAEAEKKIKEIEAQVKDMTVKHQLLEKAVVHGQRAFEKLSTFEDDRVRQEAAVDLGLPQGGSAGLQAQSARTSAVRTASVRSEETDARHPEEGGQPVSSGSSRVMRTASATDSAGEDGADVTAPAATVALNAANDFTGTTLSIASTGNTLRSEARKTDKLLKKLLQAVLSGNWEALKMSLIFLDKRASMITLGMGAHTVKAMQSYEKSMSSLSKEMGKLKGNEPDYNARLAKLNSEMNLYSLNRQAISNFLRDTMTMREEIANLTHSILQRDAQIIASVSR